MPNELPRCLYCDSVASALFVYSKDYPDGKTSLESPTFACPAHHDRAKQDLNICRGGIEGVSVWTFRQLGRMKDKAVALLCAKKGYHLNHLAVPLYRKLLMSIHYQCQPSKKEILTEHLQWYLKGLEKRTDQDFDRRTSGLIDCAREIINDLSGSST